MNMREPIKLCLFDINLDVVEAFRDEFQDYPDVECFHGSLEALMNHRDPFAVATPGNSFGIMDGGFDAEIVRVFGGRVQDYVQNSIAYEYDGLMPVGSAKGVSITHPSIEAVIYAPTMIVPSPIISSPNAYLAMHAILGVARAWRDDPDQVLAVPGLGTLSGGIPPKYAAKQMAAAYKNFARVSRDWNQAMRVFHGISSSLAR